MKYITISFFAVCLMLASLIQASSPSNEISDITVVSDEPDVGEVVDQPVEQVIEGSEDEEEILEENINQVDQRLEELNEEMARLHEKAANVDEQADRLEEMLQQLYEVKMGLEPDQRDEKPK